MLSGFDDDAGLGIGLPVGRSQVKSWLFGGRMIVPISVGKIVSSGFSQNGRSLLSRNHDGHEMECAKWLRGGAAQLPIGRILDLENDSSSRVGQNLSDGETTWHPAAQA